LRTKKTIERINERKFETKYGTFRLVSFLDRIYNETHLALVKGEIIDDKETCVRVHMEDTFRDVLQESVNGFSVDNALKHISKSPSGVFFIT